MFRALQEQANTLCPQESLPVAWHVELWSHKVEERRRRLRWATDETRLRMTRSLTSVVCSLRTERHTVAWAVKSGSTRAVWHWSWHHVQYLNLVTTYIQHLLYITCIRLPWMRASTCWCRWNACRMHHDDQATSWSAISTFTRHRNLIKSKSKATSWSSK